MIDLTQSNPKIKDSRGFIQDLVVETQIKAVTHIFSLSGTIRANHYHMLTEQYNYVAYGSLLLATKSVGSAASEFNEFKQGDFFLIEKEEHHALKFLEDCLIIVFTIGPRAGKEYETDTYRLTSCMFS